MGAATVTFTLNLPAVFREECGFVPGHATSIPSSDHLTVPFELLVGRDGPARHAR